MAHRLSLTSVTHLLSAMPTNYNLKIPLFWLTSFHLGDKINITMPKEGGNTMEAGSSNGSIPDRSRPWWAD